jgi:hypothetical protein
LWKILPHGWPPGTKRSENGSGHNKSDQPETEWFAAKKSFAGRQAKHERQDFAEPQNRVVVNRVVVDRRLID